MLELTADQEVAVTRLVEYDHTLLVAPMGAGKTAVVITAARELLELGVVSRVLVVAPLMVADTTWRSEARLWGGGLRFTYALGGAKARGKAFTDELAQVVVTNVDNLAWAASEMGLDGFDGLVVDEGTKLAETGGVGARRLRRWIPRMRWRVVLSGTPVAQGLDKLFGQMLIVDGGETLGTSKHRFLRSWFTAMDYEERRWEPNELLREELLRRVRPWVHTMPEYPRPPLSERVVWVDLPDGARALYRGLARDWVAGDVVAVNEAVLKGKLAQVAGGAVYDESGAAVWVHNAKWTALEAVLRGWADSPVLVVYSWEWQLERLRSMGAVPFTVARLEAWNRGEIPVMAIHPRSCGHGLNLQSGGHRIVWMGPQWSRDAHDQVVARLWRRGQGIGVEVIVVCARDTVDGEVLERLDWHTQWMPMLLEGVG